MKLIFSKIFGLVCVLPTIISIIVWWFASYLNISLNYTVMFTTGYFSVALLFSVIAVNKKSLSKRDKEVLESGYSMVPVMMLTLLTVEITRLFSDKLISIESLPAAIFLLVIIWPFNASLTNYVTSEFDQILEPINPEHPPN